MERIWTSTLWSELRGLLITFLRQDNDPFKIPENLDKIFDIKDGNAEKVISLALLISTE